MANPSVVVDFVANTTKLVQGIKDVGGASEGAAGAVKKIDWKRIALWSGAAAGLATAGKFIKDSTKQTEDLAKATLALQRTTGMDTQTASQWVEVLKSRKIEVGSFNKSLVILSKQIVAYQQAQANAASTSKEYDQASAQLAGTIAKGGDAGKAATAELNKLGNAADTATRAADKAGQPFSDLGVSLADVRKGDTQKVLLEMSDGFDKMGAGAKRNALTQKLLGRSAAQLTPLLYSGSAAIQDQLGIAHKYGAELGDKTTGNVKDLAADQREMGIAMDGVKITLGTALLPVMVQLSKILVTITRVVQPVTRNATVLKITLGLLAAAFIAWKVVAIAATVANYGLATSTMAALGPIALVVAAIVALIAIGVLLYKNWDTISAAATKTWGAIKAGVSALLSWLKSNWPLILGILTGPLGLAVVMVIRNWDKIKTATAAAWGWVKDKVGSVLAGIRSTVAAFTAWVGGAWDSVRTTLAKVAGWFSKPLDAAHAMVAGIKAAVQAIPRALDDVLASVHNAATRVANAIRAPVNAVLSGWNSLTLTFPKVKLPSVNVPHVGKIGGQSFGGWSFPFPKIPKLATGGVFSSPTLAMVGEGRGREIVTPESLLRSIVASMTPAVHVYIGDTELRDLVRIEAVAVDNATAAAIMGGLA